MLKTVLLILMFSVIDYNIIKKTSEKDSIHLGVVALYTSVIVFYRLYGNELTLKTLLELTILNGLFIIAYIDFVTLSIFDFTVYILGGIILIYRLIYLGNIQSGIGGFVVGASFYGVIYYVSKLYYKKEAFGFGDVMLISVIGIWLSPVKVFLVGFMAFYIALLALIFLKLFGKKFSLSEFVPFGPFICMASFIVFLWGDSIINWYISTFMFK